jgi:translation initiation factor 1
MKVSVKLETSGRKGKKVTVVRGITHNPQVIEELTLKLKRQCGSGGTIKGKTIELQGDHVQRVITYLQKDGYQVS